MMQAVWYERRGPAHEVLCFGEMEKPVAARNEALIRVHASGVNPSDAGMRRGPGPMPYPRVIPDSDGAGVVESVGAGVDAALIGARVWFYNGQRNGRAFGAAADYIALDVDLLRALPSNVTFAQGATLGIPCMTAHRAVFMAGPVQGRWVLVTGGAGAVGHYAVQLATWAGATVIATVSSPDKAARARAGGAAHVINYKSDDVRAAIAELTGGAGVHHVVDVDFSGNLGHTLASLRMNGSLAFYANRGAAVGDPVGGDAETVSQAARLGGALMMKNLSVSGVYLPVSPHEARRRAQDDITRWISSGARDLAVSAEHPLARAAYAHEDVERGDKIGTVVVVNP